MSATQTVRRCENAARDVARLREDVTSEEAWIRQHAAATGADRAWDDLFAKANFLFDRIVDLDVDLQGYALDHAPEPDAGLLNLTRSLIASWRQACLALRPYLAGSPSNESGAAARLLENLAEADGILTDDREFFAGDDLARLRDAAIDDHRAGLTEPMSHGRPLS